MSLDHGIDIPHSGKLPDGKGKEVPVEESGAPLSPDMAIPDTAEDIDFTPEEREFIKERRRATAARVGEASMRASESTDTDLRDDDEPGHTHANTSKSRSAHVTRAPLTPDRKDSVTISRRTAIATLAGVVAGAVVGGGVLYGVTRSHHDAKPDHTNSAPGNTNSDQGEKENQLTPEQQARATLKPELAMARIYKPEWNQPGGHTLENIDQDALAQVVQQLLDNQIYVMETGDKDALKYVYETDPDGTINKQQFSQQLNAFDIECARYQKWQKESPYQPVETATSLHIDNFGLRGKDIVTVDFTYQDNYFGEPKDSKSGGKAEARANKMHWEFRLQHREDPATHEKDMPAFVLTTDEAISSTPVRLN